MSTLRGHIHSTVPYSAADGPGGRFVVFMQGCNFDCGSCQNPETIDRSTSSGRWATAEEIIAEIRESAPFIRGVTVSGGEPTLQPDFLEGLFVAIRECEDLAHLTILVDSNGAAPIDVWDRLLPLVDGVMVDLKALDPELHEELTGSGNAIVLQSIRHLAAAGKLEHVGVLAVPGFTTDDRSMHAAASWIHTVARGVPIRLIRFRPEGVRAPSRSIPEPSASEMRHMRDVMLGNNVIVEIA
ncbi:MAG: radical SAM protein [Deltaproteobacteria bacterium]|jgi:pyruvate formate lyase activating enzyme|nr:radical SAM protein [Deltaproteobacteria bacterium]